MKLRLLLWLLTIFLFACPGKEPSPEFDLLIVNGTIVDGSGGPSFAADLAVRGDRIVRIGQLSAQDRSRTARLIDAEGLVVSPGFIDIHSHSDYTLLVDGTAQSKITQGVTTEILGESTSAGPMKGKAKRELPYGLTPDWETLGEYFERLEQGGISVNVGSYVGATQVRTVVLGEESRDPTAEEMEEMKKLVEEAMQDGAFGLSSALLVPPNTYLKTDQLVEMASVVRRYQGIYSTHIRSEGMGIHEAVQEALTIGERAGVPVDIIHLKIADQRLWGRMREICELIEKARSRGLQVTANQYPYVAGQNNLVALIPPWAMEGGRAAMLERLRQEQTRRRMEADIYRGIDGWFNHYLAIGSWEKCLVASVTRQENRKFQGRSIAEIAALTGKAPVAAVLDLLLDEKGSVPALYFLMDEEDVRYAMRQPWVSIGSDGSAVRPDGMLGSGKPHPRWYGTFPRVLGRYVREEKVLSLEAAVQKMTSLNARKLGLPDRGWLKEGNKADLTLFDPERIMDRATFQNPHQFSVGIEYVVVNGVLVLEKGEHLQVKPGRVLRNPGRVEIREVGS